MLKIQFCVSALLTESLQAHRPLGMDSIPYVYMLLQLHTYSRQLRMPTGHTNAYTILKNLGLNVLWNKIDSGSQHTAGQAVSVLRWSIAYLYLPVTILHKFISIQSKMKWYPKDIVTEFLRIWTIKGILFRMRSTKQMQHFTLLLKYQCLHIGVTFMYWTKTMQWIQQGASDGITSPIFIVFAETTCA